MNPDDTVIFYYLGRDGRLESSLATVVEVVTPEAVAPVVLKLDVKWISEPVQPDARIEATLVPEPLMSTQALVLDIDWPPEVLRELADGRLIHSEYGYLVRQGFVFMATTDPPLSGTWAPVI